ncbi:MAG: isochorismatase family protein [Planctomycetota bacterium]
MEPDFDAVILVTVLIQQDTLNEIPQSPQIKSVLAQQKILIEKFRAVGAPILHTVRLTLNKKENVDFWRQPQLSDRYLLSTDKIEILPEVVGNQFKPCVQKQAQTLIDGHILEIACQEYLMYQPRLGAFYYTGLGEFLETNRVTTLLFCGLNFPFATWPTILEACERDFKLVFPLDTNLPLNIHEQACIQTLQIATPMLKDITLKPSLLKNMKEVNSTFFRKLEYTLGPILGGFLLDSVSYSLTGMESFFDRIGFDNLSILVGFLIGLNVGYWLCRVYRLPQMKSIKLALLAGIYCCIPALSNIPLAMILMAYFRFSSTRFSP